MKKSQVILLIIVILVIIILALLISQPTGNVVDDKFLCSDSDGGKDYYTKGEVLQGDVVKGEDYCTSDTRLKEYYCLSETSTNHYYYECLSTCVDGACVNETSETQDTPPPQPSPKKTSDSETAQEESAESLSFLDKILSWFG